MSIRVLLTGSGWVFFFILISYFKTLRVMNRPAYRDSFNNFEKDRWGLQFSLMEMPACVTQSSYVSVGAVMMAALIRVISNLDYSILYRVRARSGTQSVDPLASYIGS